jgi:ribonuclease HII
LGYSLLHHIGPLAGPVVAAACIIEDGVVIPGIKDSKVMSETEREAAYEELVNHSGVSYHAVRIEHDEIDSINILQATMKAMKMAADKAVEKKISSSRSKKLSASSFIALIDGNRSPSDLQYHSVPVIKVDRAVLQLNRSDLSLILFPNS